LSKIFISEVCIKLVALASISTQEVALSYIKVGDPTLHKQNLQDRRSHKAPYIGAKMDYLELPEMKNQDTELGCSYHDIDSFNQPNTQNKKNICLFRVNIKCFRKNVENLSVILADLHVPPEIIALIESKLTKTKV